MIILIYFKIIHKSKSSKSILEPIYFFSTLKSYYGLSISIGYSSSTWLTIILDFYYVYYLSFFVDFFFFLCYLFSLCFGYSYS